MKEISGWKKTNLWHSPIVARAYSYQQKARPYQDLINTTESFMSIRPGDRWLDLGCGSGRLIRSIWERSEGSVSKIVGIDLSLTALEYARRALVTFDPVPPPRRVDLVQADLGRGVERLFKPDSFDGITAGLAISYADHWDDDTGTWNKESYLRLLRGICVILKEGGSFIFSANVPNPDFRRIATESWREIFLTKKAPVHALAGIVMLFHSAWLKSCARQGRFHYLPADEVVTTLRSAGFGVVEQRLTYADQAWVFRAVK
jgi:SAM-dependent methyltransferase